MGELPRERWDRIQELFNHVLDQPPAARAAFLKVACADSTIRAEVETLLGHAENDILADSPAVGGVRQAIEAALNAPSLDPGTDKTGSAPSLSCAAGTVVGRYCLLERIGEGGMGEVWRAEQTEPIRRQVAFKLVKGTNTREVIARFESERQTVALMDHPAIAKVFDAGSTSAGAPYFVMEYVAGVPITAFCDNHRLTIRQRLELFVHVCEGVQHAHQKSVIHRDLKPSNILVTEVDGRAAPKIIDFGIAKALAQELSVESMFTRVGTLLGTPEYMSPEQADTSGKDIDTRTDVYSLGIILYELLTGVRPIELRAITLEEFLRKLRQEEPEQPHLKIRAQDEGAASDAARQRQTAPAALARQIRGDLDSIALKALEKDRSRRYGSASDLAADLGRYLRNEKVLAVPPSLGYRARKFARRYRAGLIVAAVFFVVLIVAAGISIGQSIRANREAAVAQAVNDFLRQDLLAQAGASTQAGPNAKPDPHLEVRTALDRAAVRIAGKFDRQPEVEAALRDTMGQTYQDLGLYPEAQTQLQRALELDRRAFGPKDPKTLRVLSHFGRSAYLEGKYPEAESILSQALEVQRRVVGPDHPDTLYSMNLLAVVYDEQGKYGQAEALLRKTLEIRRRALGAEHPDTLSSARHLADIYYEQGEYPKAAALHNQTLEIRRRVLGSEHPETLESMIGLAAVYHLQGKYAEAEALFSQALTIHLRVLGPQHKNTLTCMSNLAVVYDEQGKYAQAEALYNQSLDVRRRVLGPEHPDTLMSMNNLAVVYYERGEYRQAASLNNETLEIRRRVLGPEHPDTLGTMDNLAIIYGAQGKSAQAEALFGKTLEIGRRVLGPEHPLTLAFLTDSAAYYQRQGKYALAERNAAEALAGRRHSLGSEQSDTMTSVLDLALAYESQGKFAEAASLAGEALDFNQKKQPDDWQRFRAESLLGASLAGQKKYPQAEPLLLTGYRGMLARKERMAVFEWYHLDRAREWIVQLYRAWGRPQQAAEWRKR